MRLHLVELEGNISTIIDVSPDTSLYNLLLPIWCEKLISGNFEIFHRGVILDLYSPIETLSLSDLSVLSVYCRCHNENDCKIAHVDKFREFSAVCLILLFIFSSWLNQLLQERIVWLQIQLSSPNRGLMKSPKLQKLSVTAHSLLSMRLFNLPMNLFLMFQQFNALI